MSAEEITFDYTAFGLCDPNGDVLDGEAPDAFGVDYECEDCTSSWSEDYERGATIHVSDGAERRVTVQEDCMDIPVECPMCESRRHVTVIDRYGVQNDDSPSLEDAPFADMIGGATRGNMIAFRGDMSPEVLDEIHDSDWKIRRTALVTTHDDVLDNHYGLKVEFEHTEADS